MTASVSVCVGVTASGMFMRLFFDPVKCTYKGSSQLSLKTSEFEDPSVP